MNGWTVRQQPTTPEEHHCPYCDEEAVYVTVGSPQGKYMTVVLCPTCKGAFPVVLAGLRVDGDHG